MFRHKVFMHALPTLSAYHNYIHVLLIVLWREHNIIFVRCIIVR